MYGICCTEARGHEAARGLSAIVNAAYCNYFIFRGHSYHGYAKNTRKKKEKTSSSCSKQSYKAALWVSDRTSD